MATYSIYSKKPGGTAKEDVEFDLFGAIQVGVGVKSGATEIRRNEFSGLNEEVDEIVKHTVYDLSKVKTKSYFVLDLETGQRGWYPGSKRIADVTGTDVEIKTNPSATSQTITTVSNVTVDILDVEYDEIREVWYKIKYNSIEGYIKNVYISNIRYVDSV